MEKSFKDLNIRIGEFQTGENNQITDVVIIAGKDEKTKTL